MENNTLPSNSSSADCRFYFYTQLSTGIFLAILSPLIATSNALLLFTIFKDPLKCFRAPTTYFIVALALVDLTTGLIVAPFSAVYRLKRYLNWSFTLDEPYYRLAQIGVNLSFVGFNSSFLFVLGLILAQFIAIAYPHHYRSFVTTRRVLACVGFSLMYFTGFNVLHFVGVSQITIEQVDLHLHSTLITVFLIVGFAMLLRAYRQYSIASRRLGVGRSFSERTAKSRANEMSERKFTIVTLLLSGILILCSLPNLIIAHVRFYAKRDDHQRCSALPSVIFLTELMIYVKVALDAFIYAWRLPRYRRSFNLVITCHSNQVTSEDTELRSRENAAFQQRNLEIAE